MNTKQQLVIVAPHVDDEVIGCYRTLQAGAVSRVLYGWDLTTERLEEARCCAKRFGFEMGILTMSPNAVNEHDILLVPHINDHHPHHKQANRWANSLPNKKMYYSVDMNVDPMMVLGSYEQQEKLAALVNLFPSQAELFRQDAKYHLFEALLETDWTPMLIADVTGKPKRVMVKPGECE